MMLTPKIKQIIKWSFRVKTSMVLMCIGISIGLIVSLISQSLFGFAPCKLCLMQRITCFSVLLLFGAAYYFYILSNSIWKVLYMAGGIGLIACSAIAIYQLLVQFGFLPEPQFCSVDTSYASKSIDELKEMLESKPYISSSCKELGPTVFGFPISFFSALGSMLGFMYICVVLSFRKSKFFLK